MLGGVLGSLTGSKSETKAKPKGFLDIIIGIIVAKVGSKVAGNIFKDFLGNLIGSKSGIASLNLMETSESDASNFIMDNFMSVLKSQVKPKEADDIVSEIKKEAMKFIGK